MSLGEGVLRQLGIDIIWDIETDPLQSANQLTDQLQQNYESLGLELQQTSDKFQDMGYESTNASIKSQQALERLGTEGRLATDKIESGAKKASDEIDNIGLSSDRSSKELKVLGFEADQLREIGAQAKWAALAIDAAIGVTIYKASDALEATSRLGVLFRQYTQEAKNWADDFSNTIGINKYAVFDMMSSFQDTFVPLGFARQEAMELSKQLTELGIDITSFYNLRSPTEAVDRLTSAIVGNHEAVREFGIVLTEEQLKTYAYAHGIATAGSELGALEKVHARLGIIMEATQDAQGDAIRTNSEFANQVRRLRGNFDELTTDIGMTFIPTLNRGVGYINNFLESLTESPNTASIIAGTLGVAGAVSTLVAGLGVLGPAMATGFSLLTSPLGLTIAGVATATVGVAVAAEDLWTGLRGGESVLMDLGQQFYDFMEIQSDFREDMKETASSVSTAWDEIIKPVAADSASGIVDVGEGVLKFIGGLGKTGLGLFTSWKDVGEGLKASWQGTQQTAEGLGTIALAPFMAGWDYAEKQDKSIDLYSVEPLSAMDIIKNPSLAVTSPNVSYNPYSSQSAKIAETVKIDISVTGAPGMDTKNLAQEVATRVRQEIDMLILKELASIGE